MVKKTAAWWNVYESGKKLASARRPEYAAMIIAGCGGGDRFSIRLGGVEVYNDHDNSSSTSYDLVAEWCYAMAEQRGLHHFFVLYS